MYKLKTDLPGHTDETYCVDFVADKVKSGGRDRRLKTWAIVSLSFYYVGPGLTYPRSRKGRYRGSGLGV